jgi:hypothetical protein
MRSFYGMLVVPAGIGHLSVYDFRSRGRLLIWRFV